MTIVLAMDSQKAIASGESALVLASEMGCKDGRGYVYLMIFDPIS